MEPISNIPDNTHLPSPSPKKHWGKIVLGVIVIVAIAALVSHAFGLTNQISITNPFNHNTTSATPTATPDPDYAAPKNDPNRLNVLVLGIRGLDDPNAVDGGPLLTDSIQIFSYDKVTKKSSLISIPRDLYVTVHDNKKDKVNTVYEYGYYHSSNSLQFVKDKFSQISGVYIDQVVVFNFSAFKDIIDALGGIDVTLAAPFDEPKEWGFDFHLPAGSNHLDGTNALYYARSRYSSTDFDRSGRQQQIIFAIKDKLLQLNFFSDPVKSFNVLNLVRSDIQTDIGLWDIKQYLDLAKQVKFSDMKKTVISTDNLVMEGKGPDNAYILLPKTGNLSGIKQHIQDSLK